MIDLIAKLVGLLGEFGIGLLGYLLARRNGDAEALRRELEKQKAINDALADAPRNQSDAARRLRDGSF